MLSAWKGVPYAKRLCRGCDLWKVEDEEHLLLVCPNTQKVKERFCSTLPFTHTLVEFMQTMNMVALAKFVTCCQYQRTICPPWSTFRLMDSLVPNGCKIVNSKQTRTFGSHPHLENLQIKFKMSNPGPKALLKRKNRTTLALITSQSEQSY